MGVLDGALQTDYSLGYLGGTLFKAIGMLAVIVLAYEIVMLCTNPEQSLLLRVADWSRKPRRR